MKHLAFEVKGIAFLSGMCGCKKGSYLALAVIENSLKIGKRLGFFPADKPYHRGFHTYRITTRFDDAVTAGTLNRIGHQFTSMTCVGSLPRHMPLEEQS